MKLHTKLKVYLYWNGLLRFYMEVFFEVALFATLNLHTADWDTKFADVTASNVSSVIMLSLMAPVPPLLCVFYCRNKPNFRYKIF